MDIVYYIVEGGVYVMSPLKLALDMQEIHEAKETLMYMWIVPDTRV